MDWLNYHHLRYFHAVAREGSIARASERLHTSPPAISVQLRQLEENLGEPLFEKRGRGLVLTPVGDVVREYAEQIFSLGKELVETVRDRPTGRPARVRIGVADAVPKELAARLLDPLFATTDPVRVIVREGPADQLLGELALHGLDLVLLDEPPAAIRNLKVFRHALGEAEIGVFGRGTADARRRRAFPGSLHDAPFVLPLEDHLLRREFDRFCSERQLRVRVTAEVEDSALAKTLARQGRGLLLAPHVVAEVLRKHHGLLHVGNLPEVRVPYFACSVKRRVEHPLIERLLERARGLLSG